MTSQPRIKSSLPAAKLTAKHGGPRRRQGAEAPGARPDALQGSPDSLASGTWWGPVRGRPSTAETSGNSCPPPGPWRQGWEEGRVPRTPAARGRAPTEPVLCPALPGPQATPPARRLGRPGQLPSPLGPGAQGVLSLSLKVTEVRGAEPSRAHVPAHCALVSGRLRVPRGQRGAASRGRNRENSSR
uniref:Uncharacterized protein n=1 Tax=Myotis myotis TaxID=51298 RepID=A0A7J7TTK0_MYOMY|nr:hypothetical protein mMyoMyo1_008916 [Myotis myotis]